MIKSMVIAFVVGIMVGIDLLKVDSLSIKPTSNLPMPTIQKPTSVLSKPVDTYHSKLNIPNRDDLIDSESCVESVNWFDYYMIQSLSIWNNQMEILYNHNEMFMWQYPCGSTYNTKPIYYMHVTKNATNRVLFWKSPKDLIWKHPINYYKTLDKGTCIFVLRTNKTTDYIVPHTYEADIQSKIRRTHKLNVVPIKKGAIPIYRENEKFERFTKLNTTFISNSDFSYSQGYLTIDPLQIEYGEVFYYGFNRQCNRIYFARQLCHFEHVPDYVPAELFISNPIWHPFRVFSFIYIYSKDWIYIFPHVNLMEEMKKFKNPLIVQTRVTMMHRNTFFRCAESKGSVPEPEYPNIKVTVFLQSEPMSVVTILVTVAVLLVVAIVIVIFLYKCNILGLLKKPNKPKPNPVSPKPRKSHKKKLKEKAKKLRPTMMSINPNKMLQSTVSFSTSSYTGPSIMSKYSNVGQSKSCFVASPANNSTSSSNSSSSSSPSTTSTCITPKTNHNNKEWFATSIAASNNKYSIFGNKSKKKVNEKDTGKMGKQLDSNISSINPISDFSSSISVGKKYKPIYSATSSSIGNTKADISPTSAIGGNLKANYSSTTSSSIGNSSVTSYIDKKPKTK